MTTLKKYISDLQKFADKNPDMLNVPVGITEDIGVGCLEEWTFIKLDKTWKPHDIYVNNRGDILERPSYYSSIKDGEDVNNYKPFVCLF